MRGILLAGGTGSRLWPITKAVSKQLMPVFDKPMIYYPLSTLIMAGIREILVITTPEDQAQFQRLLGDGSPVGHAAASTRAQPRPEGIAQAFLIGADFIGDESVALILGDNIFHGVGLGRQLAAHTAARGRADLRLPGGQPAATYGVVEFDADGRVLSIEEKPAQPKSRYAVPGLYFYDNRWSRSPATSRPAPAASWRSPRSTRPTCERGELSVTVLDRGTAWLDTGTFGSLMQAAEFVRVIEERQGLKIGCVEEVAWRAGFIDDEQLRQLAEPLRKSGYGELPVGPARPPPAGADSAMKINPLSIEGAWEIIPVQHGDPRGAFMEWYRFDRLTEAVGHPLRLAQANLSISARGVVRGIHFAHVPPGPGEVRDVRARRDPRRRRRHPGGLADLRPPRGRPPRRRRPPGRLPRRGPRPRLLRPDDDATRATCARRSITRHGVRRPPAGSGTRHRLAGGRPAAVGAGRGRAVAGRGERAGLLPDYAACQEFTESLRVS